MEDRGGLVGEYRAIAHSAGNIIVERGRHLLKRPKQKCRLSKQNEDVLFGQSDQPGVIEGGDDLFGGEYLVATPSTYPMTKTPMQLDHVAIAATKWNYPTTNTLWKKLM